MFATTVVIDSSIPAGEIRGRVVDARSGVRLEGVALWMVEPSGVHHVTLSQVGGYFRLRGLRSEIVAGKATVSGNFPPTLYFESRVGDR